MEHILIPEVAIPYVAVALVMGVALGFFGAVWFVRASALR